MARQVTANLGALAAMVTTTTLPGVGVDNFAIGGRGFMSDPVDGYFEVAMVGSGGAGPGMLLYAFLNDFRVALFTSGGQIDITGFGAPPTSQWFGFWWRRASGVSQLYLDGATLGGTFTDTPESPSGGHFGAQVGAMGSDYRYAEGGAYVVAPTDDEMLALSRGVCPMRVRLSGLAIHWHVHGVENPEPDSIGTNNGTVGANAVAVAHPDVIRPILSAGMAQRRGR